MNWSSLQQVRSVNTLRQGRILSFHSMVLTLFSRRVCIEQRMETSKNLFHRDHLGVDFIPFALRDINHLREVWICLVTRPRGLIRSVRGIPRGIRVGWRESRGSKGRLRCGRSIERDRRYGELVSRRATVGTCEVSFDAIRTRNVTVAADFADAAW